MLRHFRWCVLFYVGAAEGIVGRRMEGAVAWTPCLPSFSLEKDGRCSREQLYQTAEDAERGTSLLAQGSGSTVYPAHVIACNPNHSPLSARPRSPMRLLNAVQLLWHGERQ